MRYFIDLVEAMLPPEWDLGGAWITHKGWVEQCDHAADRHHCDIALDHFEEFIPTNDEDEHDDYSRDRAQEIAFQSGWIRISTRGRRSISVEWQEDPQPEAKAALINYLTKDITPYDTYEVEAMGKFEQFDNLKSMINYIKRQPPR